jgi:hypothetical protein
MSNEMLSKLGRGFEQFEADHKNKERLAPKHGAWKGKENSAAAKKKRVKESLADFWHFDRLYFSNHKDYAPPGLLHKIMFALFDEIGIFWVVAFRHLAKTNYVVKIVIWKMLRGDYKTAGILAETLDKSRMIINYKIEGALLDYPKLREDFGIQQITNNDNLFAFKCDTNDGICTFMPFSLKKNARGATMGFDRPDIVVGDDIETSDSTFTEDATRKKIDKVLEFYRSLGLKATMLLTGNMIDKKCAANVLKKEQDKGTPRNLIRVLAFPDFAEPNSKILFPFKVDKRSGKITAEWSPLPYLGTVWDAMFPAESIKAMREIRMIADDHEWSQAMCDPKAHGGKVFPLEKRISYKLKGLPTDARGIAYCDPNLSKKNRGDKTAFFALLFSPSTQLYYVYRPRCRSYSDSNLLLDEFFSLYDDNVPRLAMDGNVSQQSMWEQHCLNWSYKRQRPSPPIAYERITVDNHIDTAKTMYMTGQILFPEDGEQWYSEREREEFYDMLHSFTRKSDNRPDDSADCLICAIVAGFKHGHFRAGGAERNAVSVISYKKKGGF